jgi:hypothetical protein
MLSSGAVGLTGARVEDVAHDMRSWPERGKLHLYGFVYDGFGANPADFTELKDWLTRQPAMRLG